MKLIFVHALMIRCDGSTLHSNAKTLCSLGCVLCYLVACLVALNKTKVVIFRLEVNIRKNKLILNHLPQYTGHLVAIHLNDRSSHLSMKEEKKDF